MNIICYLNLEAIVHKKTKTILQLQYAIISTVSDLIEKRDGYTGEHVNITQKYVYILTRSNKSLVALILAIADVYDAPTSKRQHEEPVPYKVAVEIILDGRGTHFDQMIVEVFEQVHSKLKNVIV